MLRRVRARRRVVSWALALYATQLLVAPLAHEAAHATEGFHGGGCARVHGDQTQLHARCAVPCADPTHHHEQAVDDDHARTCSFCVSLSAHARAEMIDTGYHGLRCSKLSSNETRSRAEDGDRQPGAPRGPPHFS